MKYYEYFASLYPHLVIDVSRRGVFSGIHNLFPNTVNGVILSQFQFPSFDTPFQFMQLFIKLYHL